MVVKRQEELPPYPDTLHVVPREGWKAVEPTWEEPPPLRHPLQYVRITSESRVTCTDEKRCSVAMSRMQKKCMEEEELEDFPYNFAIAENGVVFEGRGWFVDASRDPKYNYMTGKGIDIALFGTHDNKKHKPPRAMAAALEELLEYGKENELISRGYKEIGFNN